MADRHCDLCDEIGDGGGGLALWPKLRQQHGAGTPASRVVLENEFYVVLVTVGAVAPGHCLILPRSHRSAIISANPQDTKALENIYSELIGRMSRAYKKSVVVFEHGAPDGSDNRPCSVSHAHLHIVPTVIDASELLIEEYEWRASAKFGISSKSEYLMVGDAAGRSWITESRSPIPSQILRKRLANRINAKLNWDWRSNPAVDVMLESLERLTCREVR